MRRLVGGVGRAALIAALAALCSPVPSMAAKPKKVASGHYAGTTQQGHQISFKVSKRKASNVVVEMDYDCSNPFDMNSQHFNQTQTAHLKGPYKIDKHGSFFADATDNPVDPGQTSVSGAVRKGKHFKGRVDSNYNTPDGKDTCIVNGMPWTGKRTDS